MDSSAVAVLLAVPIPPMHRSDHPTFQRLIHWALPTANDTSVPLNGVSNSLDRPPTRFIWSASPRQPMGIYAGQFGLPPGDLLYLDSSDVNNALDASVGIAFLYVYSDVCMAQWTPIRRLRATRKSHIWIGSRSCFVPWEWTQTTIFATTRPMALSPLPTTGLPAPLPLASCRSRSPGARSCQKAR